MHIRLGYRATVVSLGALTAAAAVYAVGAWGAVSPQAPASSCRASLVRATLPGIGVIEPVVANKADSPCASSKGGVGPIDLQPNLPVTARLLYAATNTSDPQAEAGVAKLDLPLSQLGGNGQLPDISAQVLTSQAGVTCHGTTLVRHGSSHVVDLVIAGHEIEIPPPDAHGSNYVDINLAPVPVRIQLNEQDVATSGDHTELTQRALHVEALGGTPAAIDVVVAESQVDWIGNPCSTSGELPAKTGWMTGGGTMVDSSSTTVDPGTQVSHGFVLPCFKDQAPPPGGTNLTANGDFGHFKLAAVDSVKCTDDPKQGAPENPKAGFNTMDGTGHGTCNGQPANVSWHFTDEGEPNTADEAKLSIHSTDRQHSVCDLEVTGILTNGNNQAHPLPTTGSSNGSKSNASTKH